MHDIKICLLGGDTRQSSLALYLAKAGYETAVWGIDVPIDASEKAAGFAGVKCTDPQSAVKGSRAVILPLPATADGVRVPSIETNTQTPHIREELRLTKLFEMLTPGTLLLAGKPNEVLKSMARDTNVKLIDYYDCEEIQIKNAIPTAEGAIALAMKELPITLYGSELTVLGYGRIGQRLASILHALGARVTVAARSQKDLTWAKIAGCTTQNITEYLDNPPAADVIFNTIPTPLLTKEVLEKLTDSTLIIELASAPGGVDLAAIRTCPQKIIRAASLPGRVAPRSAGKILFETIFRILKEEGVSPT